jgi:serine protease Do
MSPRARTDYRAAAEKKDTGRNVAFFYLLLACVMGGIIGSTVTIFIVAPGMLMEMQASNSTGPVIQKIYVNGTVELEGRIIDTYQQNKQSVVYISSVKLTQTNGGIIRTTSSGSGFVVSSDGYIVTNDHVVSGSSNVTVVLSSGEELQATLKGADPLNDVAVIKINPAEALRPVVIGDSDAIKEGEFVIAIGSPYRLQNTMTFGIVSGIDRTLESQGGFVIEKVIQTDAAVNPGNSGGPLISLEGKVIGINAAIISQSGGSEGVGFSIPINTVKKIYTQIIEEGRVARPWLGITGVDVNADMVSAFDLGVDYGVVVIDFSDPSPAKSAGLRETLSGPGQPDFVLGDIIVSIGGQKVQNNPGLLNVLLKYSPGDEVEVEVWRDGSFKTFQVTLGQRPQGV